MRERRCQCVVFCALLPAFAVLASPDDASGLLHIPVALSAPRNSTAMSPEDCREHGKRRRITEAESRGAGEDASASSC